MAKAGGVKAIYIPLRDLFFKWLGFHLLSSKETYELMAPYEVGSYAGNQLALPRVPNTADAKHNVFEVRQVAVEPVYVWDYQASGRKNISLSRYGSVVIDRNVLCTDWNHGSIYKEAWKVMGRPTKLLPAVVAIFSHFRDGIFYGGYFDFVFLVATKLARIKEQIPAAEFDKMLLTYPLFNTSYERDFMQLLGVDTATMVDTRQYKIIAQRVVTGNSSRWHPNLEDILSLKRMVGKNFTPPITNHKRVYISRGIRRCIANEEELIIMLKKFDFTIIEDKERSVTEQITIYNNAEFIIGPHGASFSNIIWCKPGTHLMELFSPNYAPDFFLYLAEVMDMQYSAFYDGRPNPAVDYLDGLVEDIYVPVARLEECLEAIFEVEHV